MIMVPIESAYATSY